MRSSASRHRAASSTQRFGSANASDFAEAVTERFDPHQPRRRGPVEPGLDRPHDRRARQSGIGGQRGDAADHLAVEAGAVESAFTGDHDVGAVEVVVEIQLVGDELESGNESPAERGQRAAEAAGRAAALDRGDVERELLAEHLREALQPSGEQLHLRGRCSLLRTEDLGGLRERRRHIARDEQLDRS